jgi:hypothetical protein
MKTLSIQRPRPSIEMRMPASFKVLVKAKLLAKFAGLRPDPLRESNPHDRFVRQAMGMSEVQ